MHIDWALTGVTVTSVVKLGIMALFGVMGVKMGILDDVGTDKLTKVLLNILIPAMLFSSYFTEFQPDKLSNMLKVFLASFLCHVVSMVIIRLVIRKKNNPEYEVESAMALLTNCGSIGIPLISMILGQECVFFVAAYMTINSFFLWIYVPLLFSGKVTRQSVKKAFISPCLVAIYSGLIVFFFRIPIPQIIAVPIESVGACSASVAMMIGGALVARSDIKKLLKNPRAYFVTFVRLILNPLVCIPVLLLIPMPRELSLTIYIAHAAGSGFACAMLAREYKKNAGYCAGIMALATVFCMVTVPVMVAVYTMFIN